MTRRLALAALLVLAANAVRAQDPKPVPTPTEYAAARAGEDHATILTLLGKLKAQEAEIAALREQLASAKAPADKPTE